MVRWSNAAAQTPIRDEKLHQSYRAVWEWMESGFAFVWHRVLGTDMSQWQTPELSRTFLEGVRGAIPASNLQLEVMLKIISAWQPSPASVLDLGCGDGILGRAVLKGFSPSDLVFLDFSDPMLEAARKKVPKQGPARFVKADFSSPDWQSALGEAAAFDLVVSGFSIHHQPDERKRAIYAEIYDLLHQGGVFLNLEHVSSATEGIEAVFDDYFVDYLYAFHSRSNSGASRKQIAETYYARPDKADNILASVVSQCDWLREIGYGDVDCFFRVFELALFGGRRLEECS